MGKNYNFWENNFYNGDYEVYWKLILDFENKVLKDDFKFAVFDYMKKYCDVNFSNDIMMVFEDFNSVISQAIQAIKSLLSENERLIEEQKIKINNNKFDNLKQDLTQENNPNYIINNNTNSNINNEKILNDNFLKQTQEILNTNINKIKNNININKNENNNKINTNSNTNNSINNHKNENNININTNNNTNNIINNNNNENNNNKNSNNISDNENNNNENNNNNINDDLNLNDIPLDNDIKTNSENDDDYEPLRKPLRQLFKNNKKHKKIYLPIQNFTKIKQNEKKPLRIILNSQLSSQINNTFPDDNQPLTTKSDEIPFFNKSNLNKSCSNITNNNNNIMIFNSNLSEIENINSSNELTPIPKEIEIEKIKITNEILKLIEIANDNKIYFVEKYINKSSIDLDNDYKEFLTEIINYKFDMEVLNDIFKDIKILKKSRNNNYYINNKPFYMKNKNIIDKNNDYLTFSESNEAFKKNLRNYNFDSSINKPEYMYKTNQYNNIFP